VETVINVVAERIRLLSLRPGAGPIGQAPIGQAPIGQAPIGQALRSRDFR
jgi:hypothetical protein